FVVAELGEDTLGGVEQPCARAHALARERAAVRTRDGALAHARAPWRSSSFWILPRLLRGIAPTKWIDFGTLYRASRPRHHSINSSSATPSATTNAAPTSPQRSSGTPTTAASPTCGCSCSAASTSAG